MPTIGEIKYSHQISYKVEASYTWATCIQCGKERWVRLSKSRPAYENCHPCSLKGLKNHLGHKHSEATKLLFSLARRGKKPTPEAIENRKVGQQIRWANMTPEEKVSIGLNISKATKGRKQSPEAIARTADALRGRLLSSEHRHKISLSLLGNKRCLGYKHTKETCHKDSLAHRGEKSYLWQGGISFEPYTPEFNNALRLEIRARDNFVCQLCTISENGQAHDVHHIDYDKTNSTRNNLVTLCHSCHTKTNQNRDYWQEHFHRDGRQQQ